MPKRYLQLCRRWPMVGRQPSVRRRAKRSLRDCSRCMLRARAERGVISCCFASAKTTQDARRSRSCECFMTRWSCRAIFKRWTRSSPVGWVKKRNPTSLLQDKPVGFRSSTQPTFFLSHARSRMQLASWQGMLEELVSKLFSGRCLKWFYHHSCAQITF